MDSVFKLRIYLWMYLRIIAMEGEIHRPEMILDMSDILKDPSTQGTIIFNDTYITGLHTMLYHMNNITLTENTDREGENYDVCVKFPIGEMNIITKYVADIALGGEIPVYGEGILSMNISNVEMDLCTLASYSEGYADNMDLRISYRHGPTSITGLYLHSDVNDMASNLLNMAHILFTMWADYEPEKASCVLSPIMQYIINADLKYAHNSLDFNSTCLHDSAIGSIWKSWKGLTTHSSEENKNSSPAINNFLAILNYFLMTK